MPTQLISLLYVLASLANLLTIFKTSAPVQEKPIYSSTAAKPAVAPLEESLGSVEKEYLQERDEAQRVATLQVRLYFFF